MNFTEIDFACADGVLNRTNITINPWPYIACFYGPQTQDLPMTILITVINGLIFVTGVLGNIAVCIVIIKQPTLHTATNYYLFNLAVSDVSLLIFGLPQDVMLYWHQYPWPFGEFFCKFRALVSESANYCDCGNNYMFCPYNITITVFVFFVAPILIILLSHFLFIFKANNFKILNSISRLIGCQRDKYSRHAFMYTAFCETLGYVNSKIFIFTSVSCEQLKFCAIRLCEH
ncbi:hypothetical protein ABEB36_004045 [Hypothenemus hampei]|uniref:G-protein coupled receptors family 1 profile domain-containing protein n=1 Tax=Hypothenemus hampei TaxID=57062 RepID=A0ABD1F1Z9_HYPHA